MTSPALDFLLNRRSHPAKTLSPPAPDRDEIRTLLTAAARSPDHGKLEPWRFIVLQTPALARLADLVVEIGTEEGRAEVEIEKLRLQYAESPLAIAVVSSPRPSEKIPQVEQLLSAGAVCLSLLNAALAVGWGANWLTGWAIYDPQFQARALGLMSHESVVGVIHIGSRTLVAQDRPRPDIDAITTWAEG
jgi:nitroreductase